MKLETLSACLVCDADQLEILDAECNISRCMRCGFVFHNPRPSFDELVNFYSRPSQYDVWLEQLEPRDRMWKRRLKIILPFRKPGSLLDVGTGIGQFLSVARPYYSQVCGTEVSSTAVAIAKRKYDIDLIPGTLEDMANAGKVFDNISLFHVLEHVPNPMTLLRTCHSLLSPDGVLMIAVPNEVASLRSSLKRRLVAAGILKPRTGAGPFGLQRITLADEMEEVHLSHFTPCVLANLLRRSGFEIVKQTLDPHYIRTTRTEKFRADLYYNACLAIDRLFHVNFYDTMLAIAQKVFMAGERQLAA